ncbi:uncharacterized protein LOC124941787 isoform X2 [Impatiens glandulifera]|nr:uncharacterized protein LOC124941787 isoform X2 [Impatiens glandulifera]
MEPKSVMETPSIISSIDPMDIGLGSSERCNATTAKPRKKTMTSVYLKFFETASDGKSRRCKFCGQSYSIATATGNLGRHLSNRHPGYDETRDIAANSASQQHNATTIKKPQSQPKSPPQMDLDHLNWLLIKWLILSSLPTNALEEKWLSNSFKFLNPSVQLWPGEKFQAVLGEVFRSMQEDARAILEQASSKLSITLDLWTSYEQIYYMSITCQWIDENWIFQKVLLDICHVPSPCSGSEIYNCIVKVLKVYNIENRILSCTHDNSPVGMHACLSLKEDIDTQKVGPFCYIPCAARTLNSIVNDGLKTTRSVISKVREFVLEINGSLEMRQEFLHLTNAYQEGNWKFPLDVSPRWSGSYQMIDLVHKASKSLDNMMRKYDGSLVSSGGGIPLNSAEKNAVNVLHSFLEPFYKTITNMCNNKILTVGLVVFFMDHICEMLYACRDSRHNPEWLKNAAADMISKSRKYNEQNSNIFTYMTAILDPRIKIELIPETLNSDHYLEEARAHFIRNYCNNNNNNNHFPTLTGGSYGSGSHEVDEVSFAEEIARKKRRGSLNSATDELTQYLSEPPALIATDVLEWWRVNSSRYPRLSVMARDFLAVQATSVAPEVLFCGEGDRIDRERLPMPYGSMRVVLCVKSWSEGGIKLKYKSSEIDYDRLMELGIETAGNNELVVYDNKKQKL